MAQRQLPNDFRKFIECLNKYEVKYLLVGGWAVGIYGNPRATKDIDFLALSIVSATRFHLAGTVCGFMTARRTVRDAPVSEKV